MQIKTKEYTRYFDVYKTKLGDVREKIVGNTDIMGTKNSYYIIRSKHV
jgi:hypothetical protein